MDELEALREEAAMLKRWVSLAEARIGELQMELNEAREAQTPTTPSAVVANPPPA